MSRQLGKQNYGHQGSILGGLSYIAGDKGEISQCSITVCVDLMFRASKQPSQRGQLQEVAWMKAPALGR